MHSAHSGSSRRVISFFIGGETTEAPADGDETQDPGDYDPESYVVITSPEDLMAFNKAVNEDMEYFDDKTVVFLADIDTLVRLSQSSNAKEPIFITLSGIVTLSLIL